MRIPADEVGQAKAAIRTYLRQAHAPSVVKLISEITDEGRDRQAVLVAMAELLEDGKIKENRRKNILLNSP